MSFPVQFIDTSKGDFIGLGGMTNFVGNTAIVTAGVAVLTKTVAVALPIFDLRNIPEAVLWTPLNVSISVLTAGSLALLGVYCAISFGLQRM